ncbi:MAG: right-handed parallel beta-helix repeat-containing protein [bacterium]
MKLKNLVFSVLAVLLFATSGHPRTVVVGIGGLTGVEDQRGFPDFETAVSTLCPTGDTSPEKTLQISEVTAVAANTTVCKPLTLEFTGKGRLDPATGVVVTVNGPWIAPLKQVVQCVGSETCVSFGIGSVKEVFPNWWGTDGPAIQAAINAAPANGRVYIPKLASAYVATTTITVSKALTITGDLPEINQLTINTKLFVVTASDVHFSFLHLTGPQFALNRSSERAIDVAGASSSAFVSNITIKNCKITTWGEYGIFMRFVEDFDVSDNIIQDIFLAGQLFESVRRGEVSGNKIKNIVGLPNAYGITLTRVEDDSLITHPRSSDVSINGNEVVDVPTWHAYDTHGGESLTFLGNTAKNVLRGIAVGSSDNGSNNATFAPLNVVVSGNTLNSGVTNGTRDEGILFTGAAGTLGSPTEKGTGVISGNLVYGFGDETSGLSGGVHIKNTQGLSVVGNTIIEGSLSGIVVDNDNYDFTITGNAIIDPWTNGGGAAGIRIPSDYATGVITGNTIAKDAKVAPTVLNRAIEISIDTNTNIKLGVNRIEEATNLIIGSAFNFAAAITELGSKVATLIIPTVTASITSNVTVPSNVTLEFTGTGQLDVGSGFTVTVNGPVISAGTTASLSSGLGSVVFGSQRLNTSDAYEAATNTFTANQRINAGLGINAAPPATGGLSLSATTFASLGTPANGTFFYCSDCTVANPCAGAGTGALAKRLNGAWVCN